MSAPIRDTGVTLTSGRRRRRPADKSTCLSLRLATNRNECGDWSEKEVVCENHSTMTSEGGSREGRTMHPDGDCDQIVNDASDDSDESIENKPLSPLPAKGHVKDNIDLKNLLCHPPELDSDDNGRANDVDSVDIRVSKPTTEEQASSSGARSNLLAIDNQGSSLFEDREFDFLSTEPVKRSTSLKTGKTPPGTPKRKAVRFADAMGLDLESVRHILNLEDPPQVPSSAMKDLDLTAIDDSVTRKIEGTYYLAVCFPQPGAEPDFLKRVSDDKVVLENCVVRNMNVDGTARVANITYNKTVMVRYTVNNWLTYKDINCSYVQNSNDGVTDRFSFSISVPAYFSYGSKLQFAMYFVADGCTYWDNNFGRNYVVECYARNEPGHSSDRSWIHFL